MLRIGTYSCSMVAFDSSSATSELTLAGFLRGSLATNVTNILSLVIAILDHSMIYAHTHNMKLSSA